VTRLGTVGAGVGSDEPHAVRAVCCAVPLGVGEAATRCRNNGDMGAVATCTEAAVGSPPSANAPTRPHALQHGPALQPFVPVVSRDTTDIHFAAPLGNTASVPAMAAYGVAGAPSNGMTSNARRSAVDRASNASSQRSNEGCVSCGPREVPMR
jgi:hypothetical protein